ncbi:MAG: acyltransferase [Rhodospirillales bacterium]|nr:acyltransferase [Rhodospirillales bacterium]
MQRSELSPAQTVYLDLLRAGGALLVLFGHAAHYFLPQSWLANGIAQGVGVYIFFLISGFLITLSVLQKLDSPSYGFGDYFCDRFFRIYAAFVPALILVGALDWITVAEPAYQWRRDYNLQTWLGNLVMLQDYPVFQVLRRLGVPDQAWMVAPFGSARPFWTISIEWWIYMTFGGVMFFIVRRGGEIGALGLIALAVVAIEPLYHFVGGFGQCLTMLWIVGSGAALLFHRFPKLRARWPRLADARLRRVSAALAGAAIVFMAGRFFATRGEVYELQFGLFLALFVFGVLFSLSGVRIGGGGAAAVGFLAAYSYSLYLIHHSLLDVVWVERPDFVGDPLAFWAMILVCNLAAIAFWWLFERHHRALSRLARGRLRRRRAAVVAG